MDLKKFIEPTKLDNTDNNQNHGDSKFSTTDLIFLRSTPEVDDIPSQQRITYPTDYAVMNYTMMSFDSTGDEKRKSCWTWCRSAYSTSYVEVINLDGDLIYNYVYDTYGGLCPALHLNLSSIISARSASRDFFQISEYKVDRTIKYRTIEFGEYPKTYVGDRLNKQLNNLLTSGSRLKLTGKTYTGYMEDGDITYNSEYEFEGNKYVRVKTKRYDSDSQFSDGTMAPMGGTYCWVKVEPIVWKINNWDELPRELNPRGNGEARYIDIQTQEAILSGIPFYPNYDDANCSMWQNSTVRGYLNGINVNNIKINGNTRYTAPNGGDFENQNNFLSEAFEISLIKKVTDNFTSDNLDINNLPEKYRKAYALGAGLIAKQDMQTKPTNLLTQAIINRNNSNIVSYNAKLSKVKVSKQSIPDVRDEQILKSIVDDISLITNLDESFVRQYKKELIKIVVENSTASIDQRLELIETITNDKSLTK